MIPMGEFGFEILRRVMVVQVRLEWGGSSFLWEKLSFKFCRGEGQFIVMGHTLLQNLGIGGGGRRVRSFAVKPL